MHGAPPRAFLEDSEAAVATETVMADAMTVQCVIVFS